MGLIKKLLVLTIVFFISIRSYSQTEVIEIDSITGSASKVMPYNKAFTIKVLIDAEDVNQVFIIKKYKYFDLEGTISHYTSFGRSYTVPEIPANYYYVRKIAEKNYLFLTFADEHVLEPSASYYIIISQKKLGGSVLGFFDNVYLNQTAATAADRATGLVDAIQSLSEYENSMRKVFGNAIMGYYTVASFTSVTGGPAFLANFNTNLMPLYTTYNTAATLYRGNVLTNSGLMVLGAPNFDSLTFKQLYLDTTVNPKALEYLMGKDLSLNTISSDINTVLMQARLANVLNGSQSLECIFCNPVNVNSTLLSDFNKRVANIESSILLLNNLKRALSLLEPISGVGSNIPASRNNIIAWINFLQASKTDLKGLIRLRKGIEAAIVRNLYGGFSFQYASLASGNSYLNFETRNKVLLTPDFGIVTSAITKKGQDFDYGIVPYMGFHINFMAVDKDIPFGSYKKNWKQHYSLMMGYSLVNMKQDSTYDNFFEKSSLLIGLGYRINNVIRVTAGAQCLFKISNYEKGYQSKKLQGYPFVGISIDLNVKQYLNGFVELFSGIGKTKLPKPASSGNNQ